MAGLVQAVDAADIPPADDDGNIDDRGAAERMNQGVVVEDFGDFRNRVGHERLVLLKDDGRPFPGAERLGARYGIGIGHVGIAALGNALFQIIGRDGE